MEFEQKKIGDICLSSCSGGTPKSTERSYYDGGTIPWLTTSEVNFKDIYDTENKITELGLEKSSAKYIPINSVIVAMYGVTAGRSAIAKIELTTNQACCNLQINEEIAHFRFVYYYLMMQSDQLNKLANGGAQQNLNSLIIKKFKIILPELLTQKKISQVLSNYDQLIENNNKRIKLLESMAEELYKEWFVRFRFPGHEMVEFENGLPKGWEIKRIMDFGNIRTGKTPSTEVNDYYGEDYLFVKTPDMHSNIIVINSGEKLSELGNKTQKNCLLPPYSIMVSCIGTGGVTAINYYPAHTNQQINSIILKNKNQLEWLFFQVKSMKETIIMFGNTGSTMTNLSKGKFQKLKLLKPTDDLIFRFSAIIRTLIEEEINYLKQNELLSQQRDSLLPRLMSGKIDLEDKEVI